MSPTPKDESMMITNPYPIIEPTPLTRSEKRAKERSRAKKRKYGY